MEKSTKAVGCSASEGCEGPAGIDVIPLTEASTMTVDHDVSDENYESALESFRQQWKQELQAGTKRMTDFDGRAVNKNLHAKSGLKTSDRPSTTPIPSSYSHGSSKKQTSYRSSPVTCHVTVRGSEGADPEPSSAPPGGGGGSSSHHALRSVPSPLAARKAAQDRRQHPGGDGLTSNKNNNNADDAIRLQGSDEDLKEDKARALYIRGVELERAGQLYEAIQQYRRAMQLVPDIESIALQQAADSDDESSSDCEDDQSPELGGTGGLYAQLMALLAPSAPVCQPLYQQQAVHLSALPREIVEQVLCWVVGGDLDIRSLHAVAATCRGLYVVTRAETLWKKACVKVWGKGCSLGDHAPPSPPALREGAPYGNSWRRMFLTRPQPRYNGCYISKTSYFRSGECNFHDQNYQPWHLVCYYRFIRFFPGGTALLFTSSEAPQAVVGHLAHRDPKHAQVVCGRYWLEGALVRLEFRRLSGGKRPPPGHGHNRTRGRRRGQGTTDVSETILDMCLELTSARRAGSRCWFLCWRSYTISSLLYTGQMRSTPVDVSQTDTFPQLAFSRVKSYTRDSTESL